MILYLLRHGPAEDAAPGGDDATRALTPEGIKKTTLTARGLARLMDTPDAVFTSEKIRAMQTAKIIGDVFKLVPRPLAVLAEGTAEDVVAAVARLKHKSVVLVGHEPTLGRVAALLCTGVGVRSFVQPKKAGCICLEWPASAAVGTAQMRWLATPKMLRRLVQ